MNFWRDGRLGINSNEILFETDEENKSWFNQLKFDPRRPGIFTSYYNSHGYPSWREREGVPLSFSSGKGRITTSTFVSDDLFFQLGEKLYLKVGFNDSFSDPDFFAWELVFADPDQINEAELDPIYW